MTIAVAWIRKVGNGEELLFASDSRLTGGYNWDTAQKIFPIAGLNAVISFAGAADLAVPVIHQLMSACTNHAPLGNGSMDINRARGYLLNILNSMRADFKDYVVSLLKDFDESTFFLFGGYSYVQKSLTVSRIYYNKTQKKFDAQNARHWSANHDNRMLLAFCGNHHKEYLETLSRLTWDDAKATHFDMEPLYVLVDMLRSKKFATIGGAPQLVKVYQHRNFLPFAFRWPHNDISKVHLFGRPFLKFEKTTFPIVDPENWAIEYPLRMIRN